MESGRTNRISGFGIVEVLVSAMILVMIVGATVALGSASIRSGTISSDKTVAYNLAQEALEIVRSIRDTAWIDEDTATNWDNKIPSPISNSPYGPLMVQKITNDPKHNGEWKLVDYDGADPNAVIEQGEPSVKFNRKIYIERVSWYLSNKTGIPGFDASGQDNIIKKIRVEVSWESANGLRSITAETYLSNWKTY